MAGGIPINGVFDVAWPSLIDRRSGKLVGSVAVPYDNVAQALNPDTGIPPTRRAVGLVLYVTNGNGVNWYQFQGGTEDENLVLVFGTIKGSIPAPSGTIVLPAGKLYREILLTGEGIVSIGTTPGGTDRMNNDDITTGGEPYVGYLDTKPVAPKTFYVTCENDLDYEIFIG